MAGGPSLLDVVEKNSNVLDKDHGQQKHTLIQDGLRIGYTMT